MAAKPRVHEIASELGVDPKTAMTALKSMGEYVKGPSSSIEPTVARRLRAVLAGAPERDRGPRRRSETTDKVRVSDLAAELGVPPSRVISTLSEIRQHWGQNESSYLSPYLAARVREALTRRNTRRIIETPPDVIKIAGSREQAAVLAQRLPRDLPALADMVAGYLDHDSPAQRTLYEAFDSRNYFYAPTAAAAVIDSTSAPDETLAEPSLLAPTGIAVICHGRPVRNPPRWLIGWQSTDTHVTVVQAKFRFYESASPQPVTLLGFEPLEIERLPYGTRCGRTSHASALRLLRLVHAIPHVDRDEPPRQERDDSSKPGPLGRDEPATDTAVSRTKLIYLRREHRVSTRSDDHGSTRDHQWLVRGHWREQWYPSVKDHKRIWIDPHLAGRPDSPLDTTPRVYVIRPTE